jgi:hypothetical protein
MAFEKGREPVIMNPSRKTEEQGSAGGPVLSFTGTPGRLLSGSWFRLRAGNGGCIHV